MGMIDMSEGEAEYLKYRFKQYLGSISREIQNRRLKEKKMGMTIDESINGIEKRILPIYDNDADHEALVMAIETMRKYQKIEQIIQEWRDSGFGRGQLYEVINGVLQDGNDN